MAASPALDITISRFFAASPERVFAQWLDADALIDWFAPDTYSGLSAEADPRVGGRWRVDYRSDSGHRFSEHGEFLEIVPARRLVLSLSQTFDGAARDTTVVVTFEPRDGGTLMHFRQTGLDDAAWRDGLAEGWVGCLDKLGVRLAAEAAQLRGEAEIRSLFDAWFAASARKDLDAAMAPVAETVVAYEHSPPLAVHGPAALREECRRGFDLAGPEFRWDVPDLQVIVRGDIAVTWGLNRMTDLADGTVRSRMWSRGTRVFQRTGGRWRMIHQHVSFPADPETGAARADLAP